MSILKARHIDVPAAAEQRVRTCADLNLLEVWLGRALDATNVDEVFEQPEHALVS